jgi:WD40 repeat protein
MQAPASGSETVVLNARARREASARRGGRTPPPEMPATVEVQKAEHILEGHRDWIQGLSLSADGNTFLSGDDGGVVIVWDRRAGKELRRWKIKGWAYAVALAPDAQRALISERVPLVFDSGRHTGVKLWAAGSGQMQRDLSATFKEYISAAAFSPDGKLLALGRGGETDGLNGKITLVDPASGNKLRELTPGHLNGATDVQFHPDGKHLASSGRDTVVRIWQAADGKLVKELGKPRGGQSKDWVHAISFSGDGLWLAAADMMGQVQVWSFA